MWQSVCFCHLYFSLNFDQNNGYQVASAHSDFNTIDTSNALNGRPKSSYTDGHQYLEFYRRNPERWFIKPNDSLNECIWYALIMVLDSLIISMASAPTNRFIGSWCSWGRLFGMWATSMRYNSGMGRKSGRKRRNNSWCHDHGWVRMLFVLTLFRALILNKIIKLQANAFSWSGWSAKKNQGRNFCG